MILVIGASGRVGGEAVRQLVTAGADVRAFSRDAARIAALGPDVETAVGDLDQPDTVRAAVAGVEKVLLVAGGSDLPRQETTVIEASEQAGVEHLVLLSSLGVEAGVASGPFHAPGEARLRSSTLSWTILRPGFFMSNAMMWRDTIKAQGAIYTPTGDGRHAIIDPADVGAAAAQILATDGHVGATYDLTGPVALSSADCAAVLALVLGAEVAHVDIPDEAFREAMAGAGVPPPVVDSLARYYAMVKDDDFSMVTSTVTDLLGRPPGTFEHWAGEHAAAFA